MSTGTDTRTPVRRLATYHAADLREGDRVVHQGRTYTLASMRTVTTYSGDPASVRIVVDLCALGPIPAQSMWGRTPAEARSLTMRLMPDATLDIEEDRQ